MKSCDPSKKTMELPSEIPAWLHDGCFLSDALATYAKSMRLSVQTKSRCTVSITGTVETHSQGSL